VRVTVSKEAVMNKVKATHGPSTRRPFKVAAPVVAVALLTALGTGVRPVSGSIGSARSSGKSPVVTLAPRSAPDAKNASDVWPILECGTADGRGCAPSNRRVDLERPTFSDPTKITNPLFPASEVGSVVQVGTVEGKPFRSESTRLKETAVIDWYGTKVEVVLSQYVAYLDGEIEEVALDRYAQADDGSVWYFGEDVIDYVDGGAYFTEGTWLAGRDGPPAMLMPANPHVGDVYRVENVIGIVFEELTVTKTGLTVRGPNGPVEGAIVVDELGVSGGRSQKTLAPGYGEFLTRNDTELEAVAVASPTDAVSGGAPVELRDLLTAAWGGMEYVRAEDWEAARASLKRVQTRLRVLASTSQPPRVMKLLAFAVKQLTAATKKKSVIEAQRAYALVAQSAIDLEARYLPEVEVEVARFHAHTQQLRIEATTKKAAGVRAEIAALGWIADRLVGVVDEASMARISTDLAALRVAAESGDLVAAADHAVRLGSTVRNASSPTRH
jgi:hypothetical protein